MKKKLCKIVSLILALAMPFTASCGKNKSETPVEPENPSGVVDPEPENPSSGDETGKEEGSESGGEGEGQTGETLYFPEYEPDEAPTKKITAQFPRIASGDNYRIALDSDGKAWAWGDNDWGQLGNGEQTMPCYDATAFTPQEVKTDARFVSVSATTTCVLAIDTEGGLWGWGSFEHPEKDVDNVYALEPIQLLTDRKFKWAEAASGALFAIDDQGRLWAWGASTGLDIDGTAAEYVFREKRFSYVSSNGGLTYLIDTDGKLWGWNSNLFAQLGNGTTAKSNTLAEIMPETKFAQVSTRGTVTYALDENGNLWGWGFNKTGQLGDGTKETQPFPVQIMSGKYFSCVYAGSDRNYAIDVRGKLWFWGEESEVLSTKYYPQALDSDVRFCQISEGLSLDENGEMQTWGRNFYAELGDGVTHNILSPVQVFEEMSFKKIESDRVITYAIDTNGRLWGWGEVGFDTQNSITQYFPEMRFKEIAARRGTLLAIDTNGRLWGWGSCQSGRLGGEVKEDPVDLVPIMRDKKFVKVAVGEISSFAIDEKGNLWAWGSGVLGLGNIRKQDTPAIVKQGTQFAQVCIGHVIAAAVDVDGNLWGWGNNRAGQLAYNENVYEIDEPVRFRKGNKFSTWSLAVGYYDDVGSYAIDCNGKLNIMSGTKSIIGGYPSVDKTFSSISSGGRHTLSLDTDGRIWAWGYNSHGQLGVVDKGVVVHVSDCKMIMPEKKFSYVCAGGYSSFAIDMDGKLWSWGENILGILNGVGSPKSSPEKIVLQ